MTDEDVLLAVREHGPITVKRVTTMLGAKRHRIDQALHRLLFAGRVQRSPSWPAKWSEATETPSAAFMVEKIESALQLLGDAMGDKRWGTAHPAIRQAIEHASVELMRGIGEA